MARPETVWGERSTMAEQLHGANGRGQDRLGETGSAPLVSVIISAYNVAPFIHQAVQSVLAQTVSDLEVIVVDDGSTDETAEVVRSIQDSRLRLLRTPNCGLPSAQNTGIEAARGEFVAFLDGDDFWSPNMLERHLQFHQQRLEADLVFSLSCVVDEHGRELGVMKPWRGDQWSFAEILIENPIGNGSSVTIRRAALDQAGPFDESLRAGNDLDMWLRLSRLRPGNVVCLPEVLVRYRRRPGQLTRNWRRMRDAYERVLEKARRLDAGAVTRVEHLSRSDRSRFHAFVAYESGELADALRLLGQSITAAPSKALCDARTWLLGAAILCKAALPTAVHARLERFFFAAQHHLLKLRQRA